MIQLLTRGSGLRFNSGQTFSAWPNLSKVTAAFACRRASRSFSSSATSGRCQIEAVTSLCVSPIEATETGR